MIGRTISHYNILEKLGQGGMGVVYLARDIKLERKVALKFLPKHISSDSEEKTRFKIEAKAAASLNHPNIATIYAIEEADNEMFIVMEYVKGVELKDKIKSGEIPKDEAINIAIQIAEGLEAAHKEDIVHRDIKSSNIMITESGIVKIMDFGLAKIKGGSQLTQLGTTVGTVAYMSPEQSRGDEVDHRADIWSFGVVLYEMLTGKMPFKGDYEQAIIYSILNQEPEPVSEIDAGLQHIISKSLAKNLDNRYQSAGEIAGQLRTIGEGRKIKTIVKKPKLPWMIAGVMVILIAVAFYLFMPSLENVKKTDAVQSIAVLPFVNMSSDPDQDYFSDGLSEELLNVLAKNPKLSVTSHSSSFSFKGKGVDIKTIAAKLNVKHILEGSVRKSGNALRITAELINVDKDATLWSNTYDGKMDNIFALQDSISHSVAEALNVALLGKETTVQVQKTDPEAYNAYLLGKHFFDLGDKENLEKAAGYYEQALSIDPGYAPAWVELSRVHISLADQIYVHVDVGYSKARQELEKALELNPNLADAYSGLGWIKALYDWDWTGANESNKRALELEPGNADVIRQAAVFSATLGRFDEAIKLDRRSIELYPVSAPVYNNLGLHTWYAGLLDESEAAFRKCLVLNPHYPGEHMNIGIVCLDKGKPDLALAEMNKEPEPIWQMQGLAIVYHALGKKKEADDMLVAFIKEFQNNGAFQIAEIYAYLGEKDKAFEWLERAYNQHDGGLSQIKGDPLLHNIGKDPRYALFMKKMKLPL